ncbi:bifunctional hydroxymethylpyrimidine kinase/phosphomethylpyrimidine kinase [Marinibactrum halimedae]|uniref:hydroxymethylpyrimidine kinase n=1 Tax=Marinibactrum halimedae TaxID=1444977 RepID=A0AA37WQX9_9GAMM|nr:hydroxymethylpyrimidine/phosphomethylpyrimidine kinase [Marinibactrum halimedae]MCD9460514.1 hydroxymethylpyrimidine/phosphomethylpyrimidine kinase [Marinibactrum halimedae]GLS27877.1 hydroxymethylpyrimidine/phosphomethylpyrimidine kinase [Marinibactrum halimedae]
MNTTGDTPVVLSINYHDPSGCSGIQADIETCASLGVHCATVISTVLSKDTREVHDIIPMSSSLLIEQVRMTFEDMPIHAVKIGFLGSVDNVEVLHSILNDYPDVPLILEPCILSPHTGASETHINNLVQAVKTLLLPRATITTPDLIEAHTLSQSADTLDACAAEILENGCQHLLISGCERSQTSYISKWFNHRGLVRTFDWPRIQKHSHGCGSTLSASIAAYTAHGLSVGDCIEQGQQFTWDNLNASRRVGMGQQTPNRLHWANKR